MLNQLGYDIIGIDISKSGVELANKTFPYLNLFQGNVYDDLAKKYGQFPIVISLEVIEHCSYPMKFSKSFSDLIQTGGTGIISTPYHGYWKNLALSLTNKWDMHMDPFWDGGHIKLFSIRTMGKLLELTGFTDISFIRVGRIPPFAKSMIAIVKKA